MFDKRLFSIVPGVRGLVAAKVVCLWVGLLADIALSVTAVSLFGGMIWPDEAVSYGVTAVSIEWYALAFAIIAGMRFLAHYLGARFGTEAAERVKLGLRSALYRKLLQLGPSYKQQVSTATIVQLMGEGVDQVQSFYERFLPQLFYSVLAPLTLFAVLAPINMPTAVVLLVCAPLIVIIVGMVAMSASRVFKKYWGRYTDMGSAFLDDLQGLETLKTFDADETAARKMSEEAEQFRIMTMRVLQIQLRSLTAMDVVAYGGAAAGIGMAIWQFMHAGTSAFNSTFAPLAVFDGPQLGLAGVLLIVLLSASFFLPLRQLGSYFHVAMNGMTSSRKIFALLDTQPPHYGTQELAEGPIAVHMHNLGFSYRDDDADAPAAVQKVNLELPARSLTAIVGESGSGKSTLAALIAGELEGYAGSLQFVVNGQGAEAYDLSESALMHAVSFVGARSHLFVGTLRENLSMAAPDADDDDLFHALELAHIADFVREQPRGLDMPLDTANLSGGQRQHIAVARALLHDAPIMIFDEATSSVDAASEALIMQTVHELARTKTVIVVTHRLADAKDADMIAVFDHGRCVETGTHETLMADDGQYAHMFATQASVEHVGKRAHDGGIRYADAAQTATDSAQTASTPSAQRPAAAGVDLNADASMSTAHVIRRLLGQVGSLRPLMVLACCFGVLGHLAATFMPVFGIMAALAVLGHPVWGLSVGWAIALMVVCALIRGIMAYCEQYMNHNLAFRLLALFRARAFEALRRLAPAALANKGKGDMIALITTDVELLEIFFAHTISPTIIAISTTVLYTVALLFLNPWFALLLVCAHLVLGVLMPRLFSLALRGVGSTIRKESAALDDQVLDDMQGLDQIIRFGNGDTHMARITARSRALWRQYARLSSRNGAFSGLDNVVVIAITAIAAIMTLLLSLMAGSTAANITAFVLVVSSFGPTLALSALPANLTQTFASARRLFAVLDATPAVEDTGTASVAYNGMHMDSVTFGYGNGKPVLSDMTLNVPVSGILGIQGPSGRGKSTLLKLLMRYWDPQSGSISMSGTALPAVDAHVRRRVQTMMSQETYLFDDTIAANLRIAKPDATDEELWIALQQASIDELVYSLQDHIDTRVGELGDRLSEGERQRIGLARMFLREADLYLFDEPTSRLDSLNEAYILQSINNLVSEREAAVLLVSHRDSTMRITDEVLEF